MTRPLDSYEALGMWPEGDELLGLLREHTSELPPVRIVDGAAADQSIDECGEMLVALPPQIADLAAYRRAGWPGTPPRCFLRASVVRRLESAAALLPPRFGLVVFDGWRSRETIQALWDHYYGPGSTLAPGYVADPSHPRLVPPHLTGGAVDLTLSFDDLPLNLGTGFDDFADAAGAESHEAPGSNEIVQRLRRLLVWAMLSSEFVGLNSEWWHFSFGDQAWAASTGRNAIFGAADPIGSVPSRRPLTGPPTDLAQGWTFAGNSLAATFEFPTFAKAVEFVRAIAWYCDRLDHHPEITIDYCTVTMSLRTHDVGAITGFDTRLAQVIADDYATASARH